MTITLPPEIEGPLAEQARKQGTTPERLAVESLRTIFGETAAEPSQGEATLFDFLAGYVGTIEGSSAPLSEDTGRRFTEGLLEKQRQGHL